MLAEFVHRSGFVFSNCFRQGSYPESDLAVTEKNRDLISYLKLYGRLGGLAVDGNSAGLAHVICYSAAFYYSRQLKKLIKPQYCPP